MKNTLENEYLKIEILSKGAELCSIYSKEYDYEYLWQAEELWAEHSPVLFPVVGNLKNDKINIEGKDYPLTKHGFAREFEFEVFSQTKNSITYKFEQNQKTKAMYPYDFVFKIIYTLENKKLKVGFEVENPNNKVLPFSLGAHPAFNCNQKADENYEDYFIEFEKNETCPRYVKDGIVSDEPESFFENENVINLTKNTFSRDALIFKNLQSKSAILKSKKQPREVKISFESPYFMVWSRNDKYVCLEPAWGTDDTHSSTGKIEEKEGVIFLEQNKKFETGYDLEFK